MAGDWIKFECITPDKPEVIAIGATLRMDPDAALGKLLRVWVWADQNSVAGNAIPVTESFIDRLTHRKGFAEAMRAAGWLTGANGCLNFPGFERHNGATAKARAESNRRMKKSRETRIGNGNVAEKVQLKAQPEKRREEKNTPTECTPYPLKGEKSFQTSVGFDLLGIVHAYPRREGDKDALEAVAASMRKGADPAAILAGTRAIAAVIPSLPGGHLNIYVVSAARFFRDERWRDDPQTWRRQGGRNGAVVGKLDLGGRAAVPLT